PQPPQDGEAVEARKRDVEDHQVVEVVAEGAVGVLAVIDQVDRVRGLRARARARQQGRDRLRRPGSAPPQSSTNTSSRFLRIAGSATMTSRIADATMNPRLIGLVKNTSGSPRESSMARLRFSSISGPRMKPRIIGAGSHSSLTHT